MEVITFEPSVNIDWTFPTNILLFTPPPVTMYGTPDEAYTVMSIDRGPIACCDVVYYHTSATNISMVSIVDVFIHWTENHLKNLQNMVACDTTWTNYFHKIRPLPLIRNSCLKNHIYDDNNMTLIQTTTQKGELTQICIVVQWLIPATFHRNDWSRYVFLSVILDFDHEILWYRNS